MEKESPEGLEYRGNTAFHFIRGDYLNTYIGAIIALRRKEDPKTIPLDTFSERYPNMSFGGIAFSVNTQEQELITELDRLTTEAKRLLNEPTFDQLGFGKIAKQVVLVCRRPEMLESLTKVFGE